MCFLPPVSMLAKEWNRSTRIEMTFGAKVFDAFLFCFL
jgi:hypothetical protein